MGTQSIALQHWIWVQGTDSVLKVHPYPKDLLHSDCPDFKHHLSARSERHSFWLHGFACLFLLAEGKAR